MPGGAARWSVLASDGSVSALALPALAVGEHDLLTAPLLRGEEATVILASAGTLQVLTVGGAEAGSSGGSTGGSGGPSGGGRDGIRQQTGPPARAVRSTARTASGDYVVLEDPAGKPRLVRLPAH